MPQTKVKVLSKYISSIPNPTSHCVDWGYNDIVVFGSSQATVFYDKNKFHDCGQVTRTLHASDGRVNSVGWIRGNDGNDETEGISGSSDGNIAIWQHFRDETLNSNEIIKLSGHTSSVTVVDGLYLPRQFGDDVTARTGEGDSSSRGKRAIVASASADSTIRLWLRDTDNAWKCCQTLNLGRSICLSLRLCLLPGANSLLLACATDDARIRLFAGRPNERGLVRADSLEGHEDWVRGLDFCQDDNGDLLLASGSQDATIRLWRISPRRSISGDQKNVAEREVGAGGEGTEPVSSDIEAEERIFETDGQSFSVVIESVLSGHDGWVLGVRWQPAVYMVFDPADATRVHQPLQLLSASADQTLVLWTEDRLAGLWMDVARMGDVGGNSMGFAGCAFGPDGRSLVGYRAALHFWEMSESGSWSPGIHGTGHSQEVVDLQWNSEGHYLLTASADQTTRLHAPWRRDDTESWHEIARPQVHGHAMSCLAMLSEGCFASGSEEKVVRVFEPPRSFLETLRRLCLVTLEHSTSAEGASVPSLGLSNKAVQEQEEMNENRHVNNEYPEAQFKPMQLTKPPTEDVLVQNTLWPETQKLYGHGFEIFSLSSRNDGKLLVSGCKAPNANHSELIAWNTSSWQESQHLPGHALTVTQTSFSPDGKHFLSVSRDRTFALFRLNEDGRYEPAAKSDKRTGLHSRIIWTCSWRDTETFATGSREGRVAVWRIDAASPTGFVPVTSFIPDANDSVTALAFCVQVLDVLAVGFGSGEIRLFQDLRDSSSRWQEVARLDRNVAHHRTVRRLAFRPGSEVMLASCGDDNAVKIHELVFDV